MNINKVSGVDCLEARQSLDMSISEVSKLTVINRNSLSNFEKEKGALNVSEKKKLISFYEERGYHFDSPEIIDDGRLDDARDEVNLSTEHLREVLNGLEDTPVGAALLTIADSLDDVTNLTDYMMTTSANDEIIELPEGYEELHKKLQGVFIMDANGRNKDKVGLIFGDHPDGRAEKLLAALALQQLRQMNQEMPEEVKLDLSDVENNSDNARLLKLINRCLEYRSLKEINVA